MDKYELGQWVEIIACETPGVVIARTEAIGGSVTYHVRYNKGADHVQGEFYAAELRLACEPGLEPDEM